MPALIELAKARGLATFLDGARLWNAAVASRRSEAELAALPDAAIHAPWLARPVDLEAAGLVLGRDYPRPVVDHAEARERTLARFGVLKDKEKAGRR